MQLSAKVKLEEPAFEDEDTTDLTIHVILIMETVYLGETHRGSFFHYVGQLLSSLFSFTSHVSWCVLKEINGLYVKLVSHMPMRGSSYLALPSDFQCLNRLFNVRNRDDNNCFLYCYVVAWQLVYAQSLNENVGRRMRTNPETYSPSNGLSHEPVGDFEMQMAFNQIPRFESLNNFRVPYCVVKGKISFHCDYRNDRNYHSS